MAKIGEGRFPTVELKGGSDAIATTNLATRNLIKIAFADSPLFNGDYTHEKMRDIAIIELNGDKPIVGNILYPNQKLKYSSNGDDKVAVGGNGLPSTRFTPNLTSPGVRNGVNPDGQQDMGEPDALLGKINPKITPGESEGTKSPFEYAAHTKINENISLGETNPPTRPFRFRTGQ